MREKFMGPNFLQQFKYFITLYLSVLMATASEINSVNAVIDLSHWNVNVDFKLVKKDGIIGVIHKATQGLTYVDPKFAERRKTAEEEGLLWGAYHFGNGESGIDQAEHFIEVVGNNSNVLLVLDLETNPSGKTIGVGEAEDFVNRIYNVTGRLPLIYGSSNFLKDFSTPVLTKCPLWVASWATKPKLPMGWNNWVLWQYTDGKSGPEPHEVKGIGQCDRTKFRGTVEELKHFWIS